MKQLLLKSVVCSLCFLLPGLSFTSTAYSREDHSLKWWVSVWAHNPQYLQVTVKLEDDGCVYDKLTFDSEYVYQPGERVGAFKGSFPLNYPREGIPAAMTVTHYYKLDRPAMSAKGITMRYRANRVVLFSRPWD